MTDLGWNWWMVLVTGLIKTMQSILFCLLDSQVQLKKTARAPWAPSTSKAQREPNACAPCVLQTHITKISREMLEYLLRACVLDTPPILRKILCSFLAWRTSWLQVMGERGIHWATHNNKYNRLRSIGMVPKNIVGSNISQEFLFLFVRQRLDFDSWGVQPHRAINTSFARNLTIIFCEVLKWLPRTMSVSRVPLLIFCEGPFPFLYKRVVRSAW